MDPDRFEGCLLGLALGDALGAPLEGGPLERFVWRFIGTTRRAEMRWTDDTQMSLDLAESLIANGAVDCDDLARRFAASYRWSRGYGPGSARLLRRIARGADWREASRSVQPGGSFGNGGAMRAPIVGLFHAARPEAVGPAARDAARVTHAHPLGIEGAVVVAAATAAAAASGDPGEILGAAARACGQAPFTERVALAGAWLESGPQPSPSEVGRRLGRGIAAAESCVTAIYTSVRHLDAAFDEMQAFVAACGGDVDTVGAMAGAIWGAANGAGRLPPGPLARLEQRDRLSGVARALHRASGGAADASPAHGAPVRENVLLTHRLRLVPFAASHRAFLHRLWTEPRVRRFLWDDRLVSQDEVEAEITASAAGFAGRGFGCWIVEERGSREAIGFAGLREFGESAEVELLYGLLPGWWGRGLATEACRSVLRFAFERCGLPRVHAGTDPPNLASIRVIEGLGLRFEGRRRLHGVESLYYVLERGAHSG